MRKNSYSQLKKAMLFYSCSVSVYIHLLIELDTISIHVRIVMNEPKTVSTHIQSISSFVHFCPYSSLLLEFLELVLSRNEALREDG